MKKSMIFLTLLSSMFVAFHLSACNKESDPASDTTLSKIEKEGLAFMREEEKMAYDVYTVLYNRWGLTSFLNISQSESSHMAAVKTLLDRYGLVDPAAGKGAGEYSSPVIQNLYDLLVLQGDSSSVKALTVGALIEEVDIRDLKEQLLSSSRTDIQNVYQNLMRGSRNHLSSFSENLSLLGVIYIPQYLTTEEYEAIINSPRETGTGRFGN